MRKVFIIIAVFCVSFANAQAFKGKGDLKGQVGLTLLELELLPILEWVKTCLLELLLVIC
jgi:hypothetical protein